MGLNVRAGSNHDYGQCRTANLTYYDWEPSDCLLQPVQRDTACAALSGRQVVFVGDSTTAQFFTSTIMLLEGSSGFGVDFKSGGNDIRMHPTVMTDITASACNDTVRLNFVRNDLLTWGNSGHEDTATRKCNKKLKLNPFVARASMHADFLVLGTGLHVPASLPRVRSGTPQAARDTFFAQSMNHTLSRLTATRLAHGFSAKSVVLVGPGIPVPGCSRYVRPIPLVDAVGAARELSAWSDDWHELYRINEVARWVASEVGTGFIDVAPLSAQRPDAAMARHVGNVMPEGGSEDCVHYCQPGPVDTWVQLWYNYVLATVQPAAQASSAPFNSPAAGQRFFSSNLESWLQVPGGRARTTEECPGPRNRCFACIADKWWWPYGNCTGVDPNFVHKNCKQHTMAAGASSRPQVSKQAIRGRSQAQTRQHTRRAWDGSPIQFRNVSSHLSMKALAPTDGIDLGTTIDGRRYRCASLDYDLKRCTRAYIDHTRCIRRNGKCRAAPPANTDNSQKPSFASGRPHLTWS